MPVMITFNQNKKAGSANGVCGTISVNKKKYIMVETHSGKHILLHKFTNPDGATSVYPIVPNFASTVHKNQGSTIMD